MAKKAVYDNPVLAQRIADAIAEAGNCTQTCLKIKQDAEFRSRHKLNQDDVNVLFQSKIPADILGLTDEEKANSTKMESAIDGLLMDALLEDREATVLPLSRLSITKAVLGTEGTLSDNVVANTLNKYHLSWKIETSDSFFIFAILPEKKHQTPPDILKISLVTIIKIAKDFGLEIKKGRGPATTLNPENATGMSEDMFDGENNIPVIPEEMFDGVGRAEKKKNPVLRTHQVDALNAIKKIIGKGHGRGKVILPTGTGKTRIEAESIAALIAKKEKAGEWAGVYCVLSPRILLTFQLLYEVSAIIGRKGIDSSYMNVNSGDLDTTEIEQFLLEMGFSHPEVVESTTNKESIKMKMATAKNENKPLIIFSTYHSAAHVNAAAKELDITVGSYLYDEAQYCVTSGVFQESPNYDSAFKFFFTATEKLTDADDGLGMQNEEKFGEVIFTEKPKVLIDRGEMASIAMHLVGVQGQDVEENDYEAMAKIIVDAFDKHREVLYSHTFDKDSIAPKLIVVCDKQDSLRGIMKSKTLKEYKAEHQGVNLCALSSEFGIFINGKHEPRVSNKGKEYLFKKLRGLQPTQEAIILHVDMIAEGLDVPGITAIMPFRSLGKIKFLQNLGRGTRLVSEDRTRLYAGEMQPCDWSKYVKPYCWLILPVIASEGKDFTERYRGFIEELRSKFDFNTSENVVLDNIVGPEEPTIVEDMFGKPDKKTFTGKGAVEQIIHEIEDAEQSMVFMTQVFGFNVSSEAEQIKALNEIYQV